MKKFNVPTQMDVILQLISSEKRKPHFFRMSDAWCATFGDKEAGMSVWYRKGHIVASIHYTMKGKLHGRSYTGFADCHDWALRVNSNRHKWDK